MLGCLFAPGLTLGRFLPLGIAGMRPELRGEAVRGTFAPASERSRSISSSRRRNRHDVPSGPLCDPPNREAGSTGRHYFRHSLAHENECGGPSRAGRPMTVSNGSEIPVNGTAATPLPAFVASVLSLIPPGFAFLLKLNVA